MLVWGGVVFSVNSNNYHLKASNQHSVIFPDLCWTRSLALISSQISGILKQAHWEYLRVVSTELLPQSVFQPRCLGKAVGHLFPDCFSGGGQCGHLVRPAARPSYGITEEDCLKLENYYSSLYFHNIPFAFERDIFS